MTVPSQTGAPLAAAVLARRAALPVKFAPVTLTGSFVRLAPLDLDRDVNALYAVSNGQPARLGDREIGAYDADALIWRYMPVGPFADMEAMRAAMRVQVDAPNGCCLCVFDQATGRPVGAANFLANMPEHLKVELGSIWYSPLVQRTKASLETTSLMLGHAFALGYRRVEWKCDAFNERSRRSALRMGFRFEGIQEAHYIVKGRNRDTAWFRILDREWPAVKARLEAMLAS
ncbi:MAG: GNAT family N-acetyltransferase [Thermomicrobia bacterium]|nr:GNAT family N-acetyltransferase [Thermomicrobia bacterium]